MAFALLSCASKPEPTQDELCDAVSRFVADINYDHEKTIKLCQDGTWKNNDSVTFDCVLHYGTMNQRDQPVIADINSCKKLACQPTENDHGFYCSYDQKLSISNQIKPLENAFHKRHNGIKKGLFRFSQLGWEFIESRV